MDKYKPLPFWFNDEPLTKNQRKKLQRKEQQKQDMINLGKRLIKSATITLGGLSTIVEFDKGGNCIRMEHNDLPITWFDINKPEDDNNEESIVLTK